MKNTSRIKIIKVSATIFFVLLANILTSQTIKELSARFMKCYNAKKWVCACETGEKLKVLIEAKYGKKKNYSKLCHNIAAAYSGSGNYVKAEALFLESLKFKKQYIGAPTLTYANSCGSLAEVYYYTGDYQKSEQYHLQAKSIREKILGDKHPTYALSCHSLGELYRKAGKFKKAEDLMVKAIKIREKELSNKSPDAYRKYVLSFNNLAGLYYQIGKYQLAEQIYIEGKKVLENSVGKENEIYATVCNNLGALYLKLGNNEKAVNEIGLANEIFKRIYGEFHINYAISCTNLGKVCMEFKMYKEAEDVLKIALGIADSIIGENHADYATFVNNLASLYEATGDYSIAEPLYKSAQRNRELNLGKKHPDYATSCNNLGELYRKMGLQKKTEDLLIEAKDIRGNTFGRKHHDYAVSCNNLASFYWDNGQPEKATPLFQEANEILNLLIRKSRDYMSEKEREEYFNKRIIYNHHIYYSYFLKNQPEKGEHTANMYNNALTIKGELLRSSSSVRKLILSSGDSSLIDIYNNFNRLNKELEKQYALPINKRAENISELEIEVNELEKILVREENELNLNKDIADWQNIKNALKDNEAAIEFVRFRYVDKLNVTDSTLYYALILRKEYKYPKAICLFEQKQFEQLSVRDGHINEYEYIKNLYGKNSKKADSLYQIAWKPIDAHLKGVKNIYISPTGLLNKISFDAIPNSKTGVLSDKYKFIYTASTSQIVGQKELNSEDVENTVLFGGIEYDIDIEEMQNIAKAFTGSNNVYAFNSSSDNLYRSLSNSLTRNVNWSYLPGTLEEVEAIQKVLEENKIKHTVYKDKYATEEQLRSFENKGVSVFHISTHGFYIGDDEKSKEIKEIASKEIEFIHSKNALMRSGFVMAGGNNAFQGIELPDDIEDGIITSAEISNLNLFGTKLAVLSACQTGLGDIKNSEGVYGLQRSFKMAGVEYLLFSLWEVPDKQTKELMVNFYRNWFSGLEIHDAFKKAQNQLKTKYAKIEGSAFAWAAFVLMN